MCSKVHAWIGGHVETASTLRPPGRAKTFQPIVCRNGIRLWLLWRSISLALGELRSSPRAMLRERRKGLGLSEVALGKMLGYSHRTISMLELGQYPDPRVNVALRLAKALKCKVEDLFFVILLCSKWPEQ